MESQRSLLFIALMVVTYLLFSQWQLQNAPAVEQPTITQDVNNEKLSNEEFVPESTDSPLAITKEAASNSKLINITTDTLLVKINTQGGDIVEAKLLKFDTKQGNGIPFTIMQNGNQKYVAQSGLTGANGVDRVIKGRPIYSSAQSNYELTGDSLVVDLTFQDSNGLAVTKRFSFTSGSYTVNVDYVINNNTNNSVSVQMYGQLKQSTLQDTSSGMLPTYRGAAFSTNEDRYEKYDFDDIAEASLNKTTPGGWIAMLEHYFVSAWVPNGTENNQLYTTFSSNQEAVIGFKAPAITIDAGQQGHTSAIFYVGPKDQEVLETLAPNLDLTIDYGFLWMISQPLFWLLLTIQSFVTNWGVAIIIIMAADR